MTDESAKMSITLHTVRMMLLGMLMTTLIPAPAGARSAIQKGSGKRAPCAVPTCPPGVCAPQDVCLQPTFDSTTWQVCVENKGVKGLAIGPVFLKRPADTGFNLILQQAGITEIFTPYHQTPFRPYDMRFTYDPPLVRLRAVLSPSDLPPTGGYKVTFPGDKLPRVVVECRDRGIAGLCKYTQTKKQPDGTPMTVNGQPIVGADTGFSQRGTEALVWGVFDSDNYDYIIEYGFRDDGTITFRIGATGYNHPDPDQSFEAHMHDALWRVDMNLFGQPSGPSNDVVFETFHTENKETVTSGYPGARDYNVCIGREGPIDWDPLGFTTLLVLNPLVKNSSGKPIGYELVPRDRTGTARHFGTRQLGWGDESWTQHDFWVTLMHPGEDGSGTPPTNNWATVPAPGPEDYLLKYACADATLNCPLNTCCSELVEDCGPPASSRRAARAAGSSDLVLWYLSSAHHEPSDEDQYSTGTGGAMPGLTSVHWSGFDLEPRNLFDYNAAVPNNPCCVPRLGAQCNVNGPPCCQGVCKNLDSNSKGDGVCCGGPGAPCQGGNDCCSVSCISGKCL